MVNAYYARKATTIHLLQCIAVNYGIISAGIDGRGGGGKRGPRWRWRRVKQRNRCAHKLGREVNEKDYAWPYPVGPVRFISSTKGPSAVSSPIHQCPVWVLGLCVSSGWMLLVEGYRMMEQVCLYVGGVSKTRVVARAHRPMAFPTVWHPRVQWEH